MIVILIISGFQRRFYGIRSICCICLRVNEFRRTITMETACITEPILIVLIPESKENLSECIPMYDSLHGLNCHLYT